MAVGTYAAIRKRAVARHGVILIVCAAAALTVTHAWTLAALPSAPRQTDKVGMPTDSGVLPGVVWQRSEFFDGHSGTCGETALAMAESWSSQTLVSPSAVYSNMADAGLMVDRNGDSTNSQIAQEAINDGYRIDVLPYDANNFPLDNDSWRTFVNAHIWRQAIVLQVHNGQALVNSLTGLGENSKHLQNHVLMLLGFHADGYSPLAGEYLPSGWWAADGAALGADHHLQFYPDHILAAAQPFAAIAVYARVTMPSTSALPTTPLVPTPNDTTATASTATPATPSTATPAASTPSTATTAHTQLPPPVPPSTGTSAASASPFVPGLSGFDISWPQCGQADPVSDVIAVIGVTGGMPDVESTDPTRHSHDHNPCLAQQWQWAQTHSQAPMVYINTANPPVDQSAQDAYTYGYTSARNAYTYALQQGVQASIWWLDVETGNSWSSDTDANYASLQGAHDYLAQQGLTVGIYCTPYQWHVIAGQHVFPSAPLWVAGASDRAHALSACGDPSQSFAAGTIWIAQYPRPPFDGDITCGAR